MRTLMFSILISAVMISDTFAQPKIYVVRHAEKLEGWFEEGDWDEYHPLSAAGIASAERVRIFPMN